MSATAALQPVESVSLRAVEGCPCHRRSFTIGGWGGAVRGQAKVTSDPSPRPPELSDSCNFVFSLSPAGRVCSSVSSYISGVAESSGH